MSGALPKPNCTNLEVVWLMTRREHWVVANQVLDLLCKCFSRLVRAVKHRTTVGEYVDPAALTNCQAFKQQIDAYLGLIG